MKSLREVGIPIALSMLFAISCGGLMYAISCEQQRLAQPQQYVITIEYISHTAVAQAK